MKDATLSVQDLLEGRDTFHSHLMVKKNVIATGIGRYLIRKSHLDESLDKENTASERTLKNSEITESSWPCILVFVDKWESEEDLVNKDYDNTIPKSVYLADGRVIPLCVVLSSEIEIRELQQKQTLFGAKIPFAIRL